ncbi:MAG: EAL domain-containing protein [Betaproteobacteria bacterium]|nr:MAG: EAL domain-containing protein [Betaproteobacteria bacterium]
MSESLRLLLVEDSENDAKLVVRTLKRGGFDVRSERVASAATMVAALERQAWDAVISDYNMPQFTGLDALNILRFTGLDIPFILISGTVGEEIAVDALKAGASDYVLKGNLQRLPNVLQRELREAAIRAEHRQAQRKLMEREAGLHRAQVMARLAHVITGPDGSFESWSESLAQLIGVEPDQMPKSTREWLDLIHPEDRAHFRATSIEAGQRGTRVRLEYRIRHTDGAWIEIRQVMEPLEGQADADGRMRWFNTLQDISEQKQAEEALRAAEDRYRDLVEHSHDLICTHDLEGNLLSVNEAGVRLTGYSRETLLRMNLIDLLVPAVRSSFPAYLAEVRTQGVASGLMRVRTAGGEARWWEYRNTLRTQGVAVAIVRGMAQDVTERKAQQHKIEHLNRVYTVLSGINALIVRVSDRMELYREACRIAFELGGFPVAWIGELDRKTMRVVPVAWQGTDERFLGKIRMTFREDAPEGIGVVGRAVRDRMPVISNDIEHDPQVPIKDSMEGGARSLVVLPLVVAGEAVGVLSLHSGVLGFFDAEEMKLLNELAGDISFALEHFEKAETINYLSYYDQVTGLANRTLFQQRLEQHLHAAATDQRKVALIVMDIERFREINHSLGRQAGDALLRMVGERLAVHAKDTTWLGRIGADHFAMFVPDVLSEEALGRRVETRLQEVFGAPYCVGDRELRIASKVGIALFPNDATDVDALLRNAEAALNKAKERGEHYLFFEQRMTERVAENLTLANRLRQALENNEFVLHYQPKVMLESRRIVGMEALIRWQSPDLGLVPPGQFISLLEETGLILEVGAWALSKAVADHFRWMQLGLPAPRVAVNVSPIQLRKRDFVSTVAEAVKRGSAPPGIDLEITESLVMEDIEGNIRKLKEVRELGIGIAIDDFGIGYSSLGYLAKLPVQALKIDRSFIITMLEDADTMTLVQTIISLAHSLRLKVIAEGVDSEDQAKYLRLLRCDEMQGYLFSRPVPFDQMTALLAQAPKT